MRITTTMILLLDTNVFIPLEPGGSDTAEFGSEAATQVARLAQEANAKLYVHPSMRVDLQRDQNEQRKRLRLDRLIDKYPLLPDPPAIDANLQKSLGDAQPESNDWVDNQLLAALAYDAADFLVTDDQGIHRKARRVKLDARVLTVHDAVDLLKRYVSEPPPAPPAVCAIKAHLLNEADGIFGSLRADYPGFDEWLRKCKLEHRQAWYVGPDQRGPYDAICIVKEEGAGFGGNLLGIGPFGDEKKLLKLCSFKVAQASRGRSLGELLLKAIFRYARHNCYTAMYVEVFAKHVGLIDLLEDFGFRDTGQPTQRIGEMRLLKEFVPHEDAIRLSPFEFHVLYGPEAIDLSEAKAFVVPIRPEYHRLLFPERERQRELFPGGLAFGNAMRKAYLSRSPSRKLGAEASIFFYRSEDERAITACGVAEGVHISSQPDDVARYVGKRTVYSLAQIADMCAGGDVLAIRFRQVGVLQAAISVSELIERRVLKAPPQSITEIGKEGKQWLRQRLSKSFCCR